MIDGMNLSLVLGGAAKIESRDADDALLAMTEEEFRAFYERTARPLWAYLARITGDPHQADDALQEAYYRFFRAGTRHESEAHRRNSLFRIATNVVRDAARRTKHHDPGPLTDDTPLAAAPHSVHHSDVHTDLARAMQRLDPQQREMLWLAYAQGASHEEIAGILGLRAISIRTLLARARRKLANLLTTPEVQR
jgi:RNA polymerase sigma-70 factor (ECF subfamily)